MNRESVLSHEKLGISSSIPAVGHRVFLVTGIIMVGIATPSEGCRHRCLVLSRRRLYNKESPGHAEEEHDHHGRFRNDLVVMPHPRLLLRCSLQRVNQGMTNGK